MRYFHKMHVISEFLQYGTVSDASILQQADNLFRDIPPRQAVTKWLDVIKKVL